MSNLSSVFTTTISKEAFTLPDGFSEIEIKNTGDGDLLVHGNKTQLNRPADKEDIDGTGRYFRPSPKIVKPTEYFNLGRSERGWKGFKVDASKTTCDVVIGF